MAFSCIRTICSISCSLSGANTTISSTRFRNSGRTVRFNISNTASLVSSTTFSRLTGVIFSKFSRIRLEPMLEVMMMMVFLKFTTRPLLSVSRPSSSTCKRMLNTSGCAFSISSNSTTE